MREFLFKRDLWTLDFTTSAIFGLCLGLAVEYFAESGEKHFERLLSSAIVGLGSYFLALILGWQLRTRLSFIRSWQWLAIFGAFTHIILRAGLALPIIWSYSKGFSKFSDLLEMLVAHLLLGILINWTVWACVGCAVILIVRFVVFLLFHRARIQSGSGLLY